MSEESVVIVRRMYEAYLRGDADRALAYHHPDVELDYSARGDIGAKQGRDAMAEISATWIGTWDDYVERIDEVCELGSKVCLISSQSGRGRGSGVEIQNQFAQVYEVEDGLITSVTMYMSPADAREAEGVSE